MRHTDQSYQGCILADEMGLGKWVPGSSRRGIKREVFSSLVFEIWLALPLGFPFILSRSISEPYKPLLCVPCFFVSPAPFPLVFFIQDVDLISSSLPCHGISLTGQSCYYTPASATIDRVLIVCPLSLVKVSWNEFNSGVRSVGFVAEHLASTSLPSQFYQPPELETWIQKMDWVSFGSDLWSIHRDFKLTVATLSSPIVAQ